MYLIELVDEPGYATFDDRVPPCNPSTEVRISIRIDLWRWFLIRGVESPWFRRFQLRTFAPDPSNHKSRVDEGELFETRLDVCPPDLTLGNADLPCQASHLYILKRLSVGLKRRARSTSSFVAKVVDDLS